MAEYAVMPKADYQDACNAVREKTGGTEAIKSGDLGAQIRAIESGGGVEYEVITIPAGATSVTHTLPRVTAAYGTSNSFIETSEPDRPIINIFNNLYRFIESFGSWGIATESSIVRYKGGTVTFDWYGTESFVEPFTLLLINDPEAEELRL